MAKFNLGFPEELIRRNYKYENQLPSIDSRIAVKKRSCSADCSWGRPEEAGHIVAKSMSILFGLELLPGPGMQPLERRTIVATDLRAALEKAQTLFSDHFVPSAPIGAKGFRLLDHEGKVMVGYCGCRP